MALRKPPFAPGDKVMVEPGYFPANSIGNRLVYTVVRVDVGRNCQTGWLVSVELPRPACDECGSKYPTPGKCDAAWFRSVEDPQ